MELVARTAGVGDEKDIGGCESVGWSQGSVLRAPVVGRDVGSKSGRVAAGTRERLFGLCRSHNIVSLGLAGAEN